MEQGKPVAEAKGETLARAGDHRVVWPRKGAVRLRPGHSGASATASVQIVAASEPVGVVAAFTPWNFPINQAVRKIAGALAAGCSIIVKGPEETPGSCAELVRAFEDAGLPPGVVNLVYGVPNDISSYLIPHPIVRKISFTGSTAVGKHLAAMAAPT